MYGMRLPSDSGTFIIREFANRPRVAECIYWKQGNTSEHYQEFTRSSYTSFADCACVCMLIKGWWKLADLEYGNCTPSKNNWKNTLNHFFKFLDGKEITISLISTTYTLEDWHYYKIVLIYLRRHTNKHTNNLINILSVWIICFWCTALAQTTAP